MLVLYRTSHRYLANFSTKYLWLKSIFLGPDSNPMNHETWQIDFLEYKRKNDFFQIQKLGDFWLFFPKTVLRNLDRTREPLCADISYS
jgi:hypothetical protein